MHKPVRDPRTQLLGSGTSLAGVYCRDLLRRGFSAIPTL